MTFLRFTLAIALLAALAAGVYVASKKPAPADFRAATVLPAATELPQFTLQDQFGNTVNANTFLGQWHLVFFGFTHCPDICPATLQRLSVVKKQLADSGIDIAPRIALVSVDPERDTADAIGQYVNYFGDDNLGITGELVETQKLTDGLGIYFAKQPSTDDAAGYTVDHSSAVLVVDPDGKFHALFSGNPTVDDYAHDLALIFAAVPIAASNVRFLQPPPGAAMSVGYLTLTNHSDEHIDITTAVSDQFDSVAIHETVDEDGVARMRHLEVLRIPAKSSVELSEGGIHLMFHGRRSDSNVVNVDLLSGDVLALQVNTILQPRQQP